MTDRNTGKEALGLNSVIAKNAPSTPNIYQRLNAVMKQVSYIQKEDKKVNNQYTYVSHDAVTAKCRQAFVEHGIIVLPTVTDSKTDHYVSTMGGREVTVYRTEVKLTTVFVNIDNKEDACQIQSIGMGLDTQDKAPGKAVSYAFKYALLKALCLETGDDPERDTKDMPPSDNSFEKFITDLDSCPADKLEGLRMEALAAAPKWTQDQKKQFKEALEKRT